MIDVDQLIQQLKSTDLSTRCKGLRQIDLKVSRENLTSSQCSLAQKVALDVLKNNDATAREVAAWSLAKTGDKTAIAPLAVALKDLNNKVRWVMWSSILVQPS